MRKEGRMEFFEGNFSMFHGNQSLKYGFNWSSYRSNFKDKYYFKIYSLYSSNIFEGIGMLLRKCGWKWMEISHEKLNLQFLFDISLLVSPFLSTPSRLYRFLSFSFSSRKIILFFISLSLSLSLSYLSLHLFFFLLCEFIAFRYSIEITTIGMEGFIVRTPIWNFDSCFHR